MVVAAVVVVAVLVVVASMVVVVSNQPTLIGSEGNSLGRLSEKLRASRPYDGPRLSPGFWAHLVAVHQGCMPTVLLSSFLWHPYSFLLLFTARISTPWRLVYTVTRVPFSPH